MHRTHMILPTYRNENKIYQTKSVINCIDRQTTTDGRNVKIELEF